MPPTPLRSAPNRAQRRHPDKAGPRRRYCTLNEAADYLGVTERTVRQMITDGRLIGYRMGNRFIRLDLDEIDAAMRPFGGGVA
jgi:excisionase family DNA binding protein